MSAIQALAFILSRTNANPITFDGSFDTTAAPSGNIVTTATRTATVPAGSSGYIDFLSFVPTGTVGLEYSKNAAAFAVLSEFDALLLANGDTLALRITGATSGEALTFTMHDYSSNTTIEVVDIVAS